MNESWTTMDLSRLRPTGKAKDEVSLDDISGMLKRRSSPSYPEISEYDPQDIAELEKYCKEKGILGVNFGKMNPRAVLNMLRGRVEGRVEPVSKRGLLNG